MSRKAGVLGHEASAPRRRRYSPWYPPSGISSGSPASSLDTARRPTARACRPVARVVDVVLALDHGPVDSSRFAIASPTAAARALTTFSGPVGFALTNSIWIFCPARDARATVVGAAHDHFAQRGLVPCGREPEVDEPRSRDLYCPTRSPGPARAHRRSQPRARAGCGPAFLARASATFVAASPCEGSRGGVTSMRPASRPTFRMASASPVLRISSNNSASATKRCR